MHVEIWSQDVTLIGVVSLIDGKAVPSNDALAAELASLTVVDVDNNILTAAFLSGRLARNGGSAGPSLFKVRRRGQRVKAPSMLRG